jgi:hypothetical protein
MPRPQRPPRERRGAPIDDAIWLWLLDGNRPADDFELFLLDGLGDKPHSQLRRLWEDVGAAVVATFANLNPGKRPQAFWRLEAPEMRRRLGGHGTPASAVLAYVPAFVHGIPSDWDDEECGFDPSDPPTYESQAAYLRRLKLLLPGESRRLKPADFEPERIELADPPGGLLLPVQGPLPKGRRSVATPAVPPRFNEDHDESR